SLANCSAKYGSGLTGLKEACVASSNPESTITEQSAQTIWKAGRGIVTGVSSPPSITNLRGRMLAAARTPLTASGSAPGRTVLIARTAARSGRKSADLRRSETSASVTSKDTQFSLSAVPRRHHPRKRDDPVLARIHCQPCRLGLLDARLRGHDSGGCKWLFIPPPPCARPTRRAPSPPP